MASLGIAFGLPVTAHAGTVDFATQPSASVGDTGVTQTSFGDITATAWYDPIDNGVNEWASDANNATVWCSARSRRCLVVSPACWAWWVSPAAARVDTAWLTATSQ